MENYQKSNSSPFIIPDRDKRHSLGSVLSAGLVANTLLVFLGILLWNIQSLHDLVRALISVNLSLIALNLFFITITDGGKLFKLRVQDLFSANISTTILKIYSSVGKLIIYVILVLVAF